MAVYVNYWALKAANQMEDTMPSIFSLNQLCRVTTQATLTPASKTLESW